MVSKGMWLSQYAPKSVKSLCITSSQTLYVRKPDLVSCKTQERLGGRPICQIYLNTYFQRARLGGRLICEIGLYASIYSRLDYAFLYLFICQSLHFLEFCSIWCFISLQGMNSDWMKNVENGYLTKVSWSQMGVVCMLLNEIVHYLSVQFCTPASHYN